MHSAFCNCVIKGRFPLPCADYVLFGLKMNLRIILDGTRSPAAFIDPGNSHSRGFQPLLAVPDAPPACFLRGTHIVAAFSRSFWFPTLRLPVSANGGGRLRSHRVPPWPHLAKYNVAHCLVMALEKDAVD